MAAHGFCIFLAFAEINHFHPPCFGLKQKIKQMTNFSTFRCLLAGPAFAFGLNASGEKSPIGPGESEKKPTNQRRT